MLSLWLSLPTKICFISFTDRRNYTINFPFLGEILQILLLYFHRGFDGNDVIDLLKIFTSHKFGINRFGDKVDAALVDSIGKGRLYNIHISS